MITGNCSFMSSMIEYYRVKRSVIYDKSSKPLRESEMTMENTLMIVLLASIILLCCFAAVGNLIRRRRHSKKPVLPMDNLESLRKQGMITEEEFDSVKDGATRPQEFAFESCVISSEEIMETIDVALRTLNELGNSYKGDAKWMQKLGMQSDLYLDLKELTLLNMKMVKPRKAMEIMAEILATNMPIDTIEAGQKEGKTTLPNYNISARMIWVRIREQLAEPISLQKNICSRSRIPERMLLGRLMSIIMKSLDIPINAAGFAVVIALIIAKIEFNAFSDEEEEDDV